MRMQPGGVIILLVSGKLTIDSFGESDTLEDIGVMILTVDKDIQNIPQQMQFLFWTL